MSTQPRGFIALVSAIIIAAVLLVVSSASSVVGFYARTDALNSELKERSTAAAEACIEKALLLIAQNSTYPGNTLLNLNATDQCRIGAVNGSAQKSFKVQATSSEAVTNLQVVVNASDLSVVSWQEVATY